jgi:integrase
MLPCRVSLTGEEARLLEACREHVPAWYPFVLTFLRLGVRAGEVCALQWGDFDLEARTVLVRRNYVDSEMVTPKNGSGRRLDVSRQLADTLKSLLVERKRLILKQGWREMPPWVFINRKGNPVDPDNFRSRDWAKLLSRAGMAYFSPHSLRHTFASRLLEGGASLPYVQNAMGHHSAAFTLQVYGHLQPRRESKEVDKLDEAITAVPRRTQGGPADLNAVSKKA